MDSSLAHRKNFQSQPSRNLSHFTYSPHLVASAIPWRIGTYYILRTLPRPLLYLTMGYDHQFNSQSFQSTTNKSTLGQRLVNQYNSSRTSMVSSDAPAALVGEQSSSSKGWLVLSPITILYGIFFKLINFWKPFVKSQWFARGHCRNWFLGGLNPGFSEGHAIQPCSRIKLRKLAGNMFWS